MTLREVNLARSALNARVKVPGSKSITNRALVCAALAKGESVLSNTSDSDDTALMVNALNQFGVLVRKNNDSLIVDGTGERLFAPKFPIPVGNAGTTLRFLLSLAALAQGKTVLDADARMVQRPNDDLLAALEHLGVKSQQFGSRFVVEGGTFGGGVTALDAEKSSQFLSSLLMTAAYAKRDVHIRLERTLPSQSYVDMTLDVMSEFEVEVKRTSANEYLVEAGQRYHPTRFSVEADASGASYFFGAAAICGGSVFVEGIGRNSRQGDAMFVEVLRAMGCRVEHGEGGVEVRSSGTLHGVEVDMNSMPDVVPTLAVVALFADSPTRILNVEHLRYKESDRLAALEAELTKLGADIIATNDSLTIAPSSLLGAQLDTYDDHRLAMSFAIAGLRIPGVKIENPDCVKKSFPGFWGEFEQLSMT